METWRGGIESCIYRPTAVTDSPGNNSLRDFATGTLRHRAWAWSELWKYTIGHGLDEVGPVGLQPLHGQSMQ